MEEERSIEFDPPVAQTGKARLSSRFHFQHFKALNHLVNRNAPTQSQAISNTPLNVFL